MPLYDFSCTTTECPEKGDVKEILVQHDEVPECECCHLPLQKLPSVPACFILHGEGFYNRSS